MELNSALDLLQGFGTGMMIFQWAILIFAIVVNWIIFKKAGQPGWAILIPVYNIIVNLKVAGKPTWWVVFYLLFPIVLIPIVGIIIWSILILVITILVKHGISRHFGQGAGFTVGLVFLGIIFKAILAFGKYEWKKP
jgi:hypothetical protein